MIPGHTTTVLWPFFWDHPGEPVPQENFWTSWCKGRSTEADTDHLAGCHFIRTNQCPPPNMPIFLEAGCCPANSVKALKAKSYDTEYIVYSKKLMVCEHAQTITVFNNATNTYNRQEYTNIKNTIHVHNNITILSNKITTSNKIQLQLLSTKAVVGINQWQI